MTEELEDWDAWLRYPEHRWVFNKLELSLKLGYNCGPTPMPVPITGDYVVRPIYNLSGMGAGAILMNLEAGRIYNFPPSYFWCEKFTGDHLSINFKWIENKLVAVHTSVAETDFNNLSRFKKWTKIENVQITVPDWITQFNDVEDLNIEFIGGKIIEIHLRSGVDFPDGATEIIPIWKTTVQRDINKFLQEGYQYIQSFTDAEKNISDPRIGFMWK